MEADITNKDVDKKDLDSLLYVSADTLCICVRVKVVNSPDRRIVCTVPVYVNSKQDSSQRPSVKEAEQKCSTWLEGFLPGITWLEHEI